jgi:C1A family cysteine protease
MKRILVALVVALLLAAAAVPTDAQQPRIPPRPRPLPTPTLLAPRTQPTVTPAHLLVQARLAAKQQQTLHQDKKQDKKSRRSSRPSKDTFRGFDWTNLGIATRVRDQGKAGTCWAHAGVEALEASVEIRTDNFPLLAVQPILDQLRHSQGGDACMVFPELMTKGTGLAQDYPYLVGKLNPPEKGPLPYKALAWGYVARPDRQATVAQIKEALLLHGPLYTTLYASTPGFKHNKGEVMAEKGPFPEVNHSVLLVGWDDTRKAWKIKNSWGAHRWGNKGYGWVAYGHYGIGTSTAWVQARVGP